ncbi:MAG: hydrogenase iron-sulfur subunit [Proteobacteria bacterium]|nr:hydrogenase iron-sulfur subunit [Pseudomonadota bacterium]MBU1596615.1 hydrogenase iron-sulfur subunit [Pseudomonadota bacterium]
MAEKLGVYICSGCDIGKSLDVDSLLDTVKKGKLASICPVVKKSAVLCSPDAVTEIEADIKEAGLDGVVLCACSPRVKWDIFQFGATQVERVNLREQCVWSFREDPKVPGLLPLMAQDYVKMGVMKLSKSRIPAPEVPETNKTILVLGGGFTGLTAALEAAKLGKDVVLVEQAATLGGKAATMYKTFPMSHPYLKAEDTGIDQLIADATSNAKIKVLTSANLVSLEGAPGLYTATVNAGGEQQFAIGAVVLATGWVPGDKGFLAPMGYGSIKNVVTAAEFEAMAKAGSIVRPSDGQAPASVAFLTDVSLCTKGSTAGTADVCAPVDPLPEKAAEGEPEVSAYPDKESAKHLAYSSELTSLVALKQAGYVREKLGQSVAFVLYDHMMVPGINERYYKAAQDDAGIMLSKASITAVTEDADGGVIVAAKDTLLGADIEIKADLVVLPTAIVPVTAHEPTMNLVYRQGPGFPDLELFDGFVDSNYICFPYETRRTGVYAAGCVRQPMTLAGAKEDAAGAVLKAVQCIGSANRGVAVHPRSGDISFPVFNFQRCTQCKRCTEECPFGALDDDEKGTPKPNPTRCRRCGTCMGACPERVISFDNYNIDQIGSMIKEVYVPDDMVAGGPRVIVLVCENDAYPALDMAAFRGKSWSPFVRFVPVRCLGSVNAIWVADAVSKGVDGVIMLGCKYGPDYQCHFVKGSELCSRRKTNIAESLGRLGVEAERVEQYEVSIDEYDKVPAIIERFMTEVITKFGPNPFKGY